MRFHNYNYTDEEIFIPFHLNFNGKYETRQSYFTKKKKKTKRKENHN